MPDIERLAREYRQALENSSTNALNVIEQIIILEENQIDYLSALIPKLGNGSKRCANYFKNVTYRSLSKMNILLGSTSYVPSFRNVNAPCQSLKAVILSTQISIFALLDKISLSYPEIAEILNYENRKLALITYF